MIDRRRHILSAVTFLLALALLAGGGLRLAGIAGKRQVEMDEGISLLAATGHQREYNRAVTEGSPLYGTWTQADQWKRLIRIEDRFPFGRIRDDLAATDVHPPLYFWLLHTWFLLCEAGIRSASLLNLVLFVPSVFVLFGLARSCLKNPVEAALVALAWSLSPAVIQVSWIARPYGLLVLCQLILVRQLIRFTDRPTAPAGRDYILLAGVTAAGLLTHYTFLTMIAGTVLFAVLNSRRAGWKRTTGFLSAIGAGVLPALIAHPFFYRSFLTQQRQAGGSPYGTFGFRAERVLTGFLNFFVGNRYLQLGVLATLLALLAWNLFLSGKKEKLQFPLTSSLPIFFLLWTSGTIVIPYLAGLNPLQQMGRRYLSLVYPFLAFVPVLIFRRRNKLRPAVICLFYLGLSLAATVRVVRFRQEETRSPDLAAISGSGRSILVDNLFRIFLPQVLYQLPDEMEVFAADQDFLLGAPERWLDNLETPAIYISRGYGKEKSRQEELIGVIGREYRTELVTDKLPSAGSVYRIGPEK